jgi:hypothetical protein
VPPSQRSRRRLRAFLSTERWIKARMARWNRRLTAALQRVWEHHSTNALPGCNLGGRTIAIRPLEAGTTGDCHA